MPGEANAIQAGINKLIEKLKNEKDPAEIEKLLPSNVSGTGRCVNGFI